jgi:3-dehydroshikimate dehydratase
MSTITAVLHSYSLRAYPREHVWAVARAGGWPAVELAACHLDWADPAADLARAVEEAAAAGVRIHCAGYWGEFAHPDPARRDGSLERVRVLVDAAARQGISLVNGSGGWLVADPKGWDADWRKNGSALATETDLQNVAGAYRELAGEAAGRGVRIGVEIHPNTVHDTAAATAGLLRRIDEGGGPGRIGDAARGEAVIVTVDPSNAVPISAEDGDPAVLDLLAGRAGYFHLKNCRARDGVADFTVAAADGVVDNYRWLEALLARGDCPAVAVEYCGEGDPHPRLAAGHRYLTETLQLIGASG